MWNLFKVPAPNCECFFEYETPKVITVKNVPMGIFRIIVQGAILTFLFGFQLWYSRGYQSFADVEASIHCKQFFTRLSETLIFSRQSDSKINLNLT